MMSKERAEQVMYIALFGLALFLWAYIIFCFVLSLFGTGSLPL